MKIHPPNSRFSEISCVLCLGVLLAIASGCDKPDSASTFQAKPKSPTNRIVAVSYPLQYLTQRIAGKKYNVEMPVPTNEDPQNWRPTRETIGEMQSADLIIANGTGATYANWLALVSLPDSKLRNTASKSLLLRDFIAVEDVKITHSHGPEGAHTHATMVARTWLAPALAKKQATYIAQELALVYPDDATVFEQNVKELSADLDRLSELLTQVDKPDVRVVTATPKLKFFSRAAGFPEPHLTWFATPTIEQATQDLKKLGADATSKPGLVLFDNSLPHEELTDFLKSQNLTSIALNLIDQKPEQGDYISAMQENIERFNQAIIKLQ